PTVLATTALLLFVMDMSFNIMTLGGMAAAVGLIIDDMIVMIEHIIRRLQDGAGNKHERVMRAVTEITHPLAGSSASTLIIFVPLAFLSGVTGAFFKALSVTMAASLVISFMVAWLAVPLLSLFLLKQKDVERKSANPPGKARHPFYSWIMRIILPHPWLVLGVILPFLALGWLGYNQIGTGFLPRIDEGGFILDYRAKAGTSLAETDRLLRQVEVILQNTPEVQTYSRRTGLALSGGFAEVNRGDFFVRLKGYPRRDIDSVMDDVRQQIEHSVPGLAIEMALLMEDLIGDLTAVPQPIEIKLFSDDSQALSDLAVKTARSIEKVPGVVDINNGIVIAGDALIVKVDRNKVALEGVSSGAITRMLKNQLTGAVAGQIAQNPKMVNLRVWTPKVGRNKISDLGALRLRAPDGHWFPLGRVAELRVVTGQPQIMRDDLKRMIAVTGRISRRDMGSTIADIIAVLDRPGFLTKGVYYQLGGLYQQQRIAFRGLIWVLVSAIVLTFALLLFLYESFRVAIAMLLTTLLTTAAVFVGLWFTGTELNITAMMGMTMVIGIATEVTIFYYSEYNDLGKSDTVQERLIVAGKNRMRPIAMTTLAAILALLPLALGIGPGAAMQQPLAIAIISGLAVQLPFVLTVFPALFILMGKRTSGVPFFPAAVREG
ncbi:MAG: efflux RND transporter permease subunit, partial [Nitrospinales bacterium]